MLNCIVALLPNIQALGRRGLGKYKIVSREKLHGRALLVDLLYY